MKELHDYLLEILGIVLMTLSTIRMVSDTNPQITFITSITFMFGLIMYYMGKRVIWVEVKRDDKK